MIILNKGQQILFDKGVKWYHRGIEQLFKVQGRAGTGKTTVIRMLVEALGLDIYKEVLFVTYVGRATLPLRKQGLNAKSIHSTIYRVVKEYKKDENGEYIRNSNGTLKKSIRFVKREHLDGNIQLIVVDESGMVPDNMKDDLLSFGIPVIAVGDIHQLPPVFGTSSFLKNPDATLWEIMRQKEGDPILHLADLALNGKHIHTGKYGDRCFVVNADILKYKKLYEHPSVIICGKNKTRDRINDIVRYEIQHRKSPFPEIGDKIVCRKNNWEEELDGVPLINGLFGYVYNIDYESYNSRSIEIDFKPENSKSWFESIPIDTNYIQMTADERKEYGYPVGNMFEYGNAGTCHMLQGSQYDYVLVIEENMGDKLYQSRWLYTAITRAETTLVLVKKKSKKFF